MSLQVFDPRKPRRPVLIWVGLAAVAVALFLNAVSPHWGA